MFAKQYKIILASKSPRRKLLLEETGIKFEVRTKETDEQFPKNLTEEKICLYLAEKKATAFQSEINERELVIAADTIVWIENKVLNKPKDENDAISMIKLLSGKMHQVFTGICLMTIKQKKTFYCETKVFFKTISESDINFYVQNFKPFDKAGAYGAQECLPEEMNPCSQKEIEFLKSIGKIELIEKSITRHKNKKGFAMIERIEGSYFNVMGLPLPELHQELSSF